MKYAQEIVEEIKNRSPIDTTNCIVDNDDTWEDYIRKGSMPREKCNHVFIMKMVVKNVLGVLRVLHGRK
jgi:hypothetical protein